MDSEVKEIDNIVVDILGIIRNIGLECEENNPMWEAKSKEITHAVKLYKAYKKEGFDDKFVLPALKRRLQYIKDVQTKEQLKEIHKSPKPVYNGNSFVPGTAFDMPEEECMMWSLSSLKAPLIPEAAARYQDLFEKISGQKIEELLCAKKEG